jgi:hypothetical protein
MMGNERRSDIAEEEIEDNGLVENAEDFLYPDDEDEDCYDDEPREREYCD